MAFSDYLRSTVLCLVALAIGTPAEASRPQPFAARVAEAKASLLEGADRAFVSTWAEMEGQAEQAQLTASQVRAATRWVAPAYSLGLCANYAKASDIAEWHNKFDGLQFGFGELAEHARAGFRAEGMDVYRKGLAGRELADLTDAEKASLCTVELEAIRQFLRQW